MAAQIGLKALHHTPKLLQSSPNLTHSHYYSPLFPSLNPKLDLTEPPTESEPSMSGPSQPASGAPKATIKFLCSYGGKILPRYPDSKLRYLGGHTRVLSVDRSISFSGQFSLSLSAQLIFTHRIFKSELIVNGCGYTELISKVEELCGSSVRHLRCQLPAEDLDALVSITSDEDLTNLIEEYDRAASPPLTLKVRAFLSPPRFPNKVSAAPPPSPLSNSASSASSSASSSSSSSSYCSLTGGGSGRRYKAVAPVAACRCVHQMSPPTVYPVGVERSSDRNIPLPRHGYHAQGNTGYVYLIHNGNHWQ